MSENTRFLLDHARKLHQQTPLIDGHNDLPWRLRQEVQRALSKMDISAHQKTLHTDIPRLLEGGVGGQFWSVFVPAMLDDAEYVRATMEQIDVVHNMVDRYSNVFQLTVNSGEIENSFESGKIAALIGMEGGHSIGNSIAALRMFHKLGARYMTLTHDKSISWADSCTDAPRAHGLTEFGKEVVHEMNRLGMLVDLSHVSKQTMNAALDVANAPVIFSHSSARGLTNHPRNVPDDVLKRLPQNGGVVMVTFVPGFVSKSLYEWGLNRTGYKSLTNSPDYVHHWDYRSEDPVTESVTDDSDPVMKEWDERNPAPQATLKDVADHIDHIRALAGIDHIGIGSDFDGITSVPDGLEDVAKFHALTAELIRREYSDEDVQKILGRNVLRAMRGAEDVARTLQTLHSPSEVLHPPSHL